MDFFFLMVATLLPNLTEYILNYDFDFDIVSFPFSDDDVPRAPSYGVYIAQLIWFDRVYMLECS